MTREEAIWTLEEGDWWDFCNTPIDTDTHKKFHEAIDMAIASLCAQPAQLDRSRWEAHPVIKRRPYRSETFKEAQLSEDGEVLYRKIVTIHEDWTDDYCSACGKKLCSRFTNYCPNCGRPLTEEAWAELERRIGRNDEAD